MGVCLWKDCIAVIFGNVSSAIVAFAVVGGYGCGVLVCVLRGAVLLIRVECKEVVKLCDVLLLVDGVVRF